MKTYALRGAAAAIILSIARLTYGQALPPVEIQPGGPAYMAGEVLIQLKPTVTDAQLADAFQQGGLNLLKHIQTPAMKDHGQIGVTHAATALPVPAAVRVLNNLPGVAFAEPNWVYAHQAESNDPFYTGGSLWGMYGDDLPSPAGPASTTNPFGSQAERPWAAGFIGSKDVFVGVVDEGLQFDHPDLAANMWTNPGEIPGNGIDDDGDGYVDDVHGWNAIGDNGLGVAGVNWNVTLVSGKFLGRTGSGTTADAVQAIDYMTTLKTKKGLNIVALNNSWGGGAFSQALLDAITRAAQAGIVFVAAAGNAATNTDVAPLYPAGYNTTAGAGYDSVISVAAIDQNGNKASFSNYGQKTVDLEALGVGIYSTLPVSTYGAYNGTSMATPHVTGAVALYASTHPASSAAQAKSDLLTYGVRPTTSLNGITVTGGRLDLSTLITTAGSGLPAPAAPASLQAAVVSAGRVDLSWTDQSDNELGFAIERSTDGQTFVLADTVGANLVSYSDRTVRPDTTYLYRVRAYNPGGSSDFAYAPSSVTTPQVTLPAAPSGLTATASPRGGGVALAWADNSNNEDGFQVERKTATTGTWQLLAALAANTTKYTDTSTVKLTTYSYRVRAFNAAGPSGYSNVVVVKAK